MMLRPEEVLFPSVGPLLSSEHPNRTFRQLPFWELTTMKMVSRLGWMLVCPEMLRRDGLQGVHFGEEESKRHWLLRATP